MVWLGYFIVMHVVSEYQITSHSFAILSHDKCFLMKVMWPVC